MLNVGMVLFPALTQLDLTGPHEVLARLPGARVHLVAASLAPVRSAPPGVVRNVSAARAATQAARRAIAERASARLGRWR